jgi:GH3 auxin-responsive promoter
MPKLTASLANAAWWAACAPAAAAFEAALADPRRAQERVLAQLLRRNARTAYGRDHGFDSIRSPEQFARRVPPCDYDAIAPWVERIRRGEPNVLTAEPVRRLVPTSGSTAARKLIPYTASMQAELNRAIGPWIFDLYSRHPGAARLVCYTRRGSSRGSTAGVISPDRV